MPAPTLPELPLPMVARMLMVTAFKMPTTSVSTPPELPVPMVVLTLTMIVLEHPSITAPMYMVHLPEMVVQ